MDSEFCENDDNESLFMKKTVDLECLTEINRYLQKVRY